MEAKLFLACNELPEIKGEDTALWRRIRVIDFPSRFVDDPKEPNEYKIDRTLPSRMREDFSWRQTFMNVLLEYFYKDVPEPDEVKLKTNEYREENNDYYTWLCENIAVDPNGMLSKKDLNYAYFTLFKKSKASNTHKNILKKQLMKFLSDRYPNLDIKEEDTTYNHVSFKGWKGIRLSDN
jgi:putative DNA primase/helicase